MNNVFTRIVESDFILPEQRKQITDRIVDAIQEAEKPPTQEHTIDEFVTEVRSRSYGTYLMPIVALSASFVGATISILPEVQNLWGDSETLLDILPVSVATTLMSLVTISFIALIYRIRDRQQEEPSKVTALEGSRSFEREVFRALQRAEPQMNSDLEIAGPDRRYDFAVTHLGQKVLVEAKNWIRPMPPSIVARTFEQLQGVLKQEQATYGIIVTPKFIDTRPPNDGQIRLMTLKEFKGHLNRRR